MSHFQKGKGSRANVQRGEDEDAVITCKTRIQECSTLRIQDRHGRRGPEILERHSSEIRSIDRMCTHEIQIPDWSADEQMSGGIIFTVYEKAYPVFDAIF